MKRVLIIIMSVILICLISLGIIGYNVEKNNMSDEDNVKTEEKADKITEEKKLVIDINKFDISKIEGYTPGGNEDNNEATTVGTMTLPYSIPYKNMEIVSIGQYSGKFVEDGSDENKENVLAIIVKNTSEEVIDYGEINMKIIGKAKNIKFKVTNLKPGACALVMESSGNIEFNPNDKYIYISSKNAMVSNLSTMESQVDITTENEEITVKNLSDKNLNTVYVYYKTMSTGNCYIGGITYRTKFENIASGKSVTSKTLHFSSENSEILKVELVEE